MASPNRRAEYQQRSTQHGGHLNFIVEVDDQVKLELRGITKRFGSVVANRNINLSVESGEIHCLLGENGAGKSTLMNILYGLHRADEGQIFLDGEEVAFDGPGDAMAAGVGMVHQHFMLVPVFTVAENVILGQEPVSGGFVDTEVARKRVRDISTRFNFDIDPDDVVQDLPVGAQQRVEIIKALARDANVLVLDEPTAVLTPQETDELMTIMKRLAAEGTSIIFITHKLREVREVADKITVIRRGEIVGTATPEASSEELASLMVGRNVGLTVTKEPPQLGERAFVVDDLTLVDPTGRALLDGVSFDIHGGEILAVAGVEGNGQTELTEAILGLRESATGSVTLNGKQLLGESVRDVIEHGVGFVPEDRRKDGLVGEFSIAENLLLNQSYGAPFVRFGNISFNRLNAVADDAIGEYDIRAEGSHTLAQQLSGGNQQKVVLARELSRTLQLFIASQPTRGLDVGSIEFVHRRIIETRDAGRPVLIVSTELDEITALADRIAVLFKGRIMGIVPADTPRAEIGRLMAGLTE